MVLLHKLSIFNIILSQSTVPDIIEF